MARTFFGLSDEYIENVYEQIFLLKYYGGWGFVESYNLPIKLRQWFIKRITKQLQIEKEQIEKSRSKDKHTLSSNNLKLPSKKSV